MSEITGQSESSVKPISLESHSLRSRIIGAAIVASVAVGLFVERDQPIVVQSSNTLKQVGSDFLQAFPHLYRDEKRESLLFLREIGFAVSIDAE